MKLNKLLLFFLFVIACKIDNENHIQKNEFYLSIDNYIKQNPPLYFKGLSTSYPSYGVYFYEKEGDTLMSIRQNPYFIGMEKEIQRDTNIVDFEPIRPDGIILYKKKFPLILTNSINYVDQDLISELHKQIPDSLEYHDEPFVLEKFENWIYILKNGRFERLENKEKQNK